MEPSPHGIVIYRASRLEALLEPLSQLLEDFPPADLLAPQTVLAAHPGIKRWLTMALAKRRGPGGIVANLDVQLPGSWLQSLARERLGASADSMAAYRRESLRWRIFEMLPMIDVPAVRLYLAGGDSERRRFQLADRLASLYVRYQVYRPNWLDAWQQGRTTTDVDAGFFAPLWRQLRNGINQPHRGELLARLVRELHRAAVQTGAEPLHVFGLSHLPPAELAVLRAIARERLVVLYLPDPCVQHWAGLSNESTQIRHLLKQGLSEAGQAHLLELGHPLLAAWGRIGQHFGLVLNEGEEGVLSEVRHHQDYGVEPTQPHLRLHRLQHSVRQMDVGLMRGEDCLTDASLRIHGCHTRLREVEVLRDALLKALDDLPDLRPSDIVVMAADIAAYAPLMSAVFGVPGDASGVLPYHLADVALSRSHPVFSAFSTLLDAPQVRLTASEVNDLLAVPAIARALGLDQSGREMLAHWLANGRVAWGLDASSRERFGLPAYGEHSLAWGVDRMLAGYVLGDAAEPIAEQLDCWPLSGVTGVQVSALGALDRLLGEIDQLCRDARQAQPLSQWSSRLQSLIDALFLADSEDVGDIEAIASLRRVITSFDTETQLANSDPVLDYAIVRELLHERMEAVPEHQPFLLGGITVCGMVPQRSIPFRVVAVLGLNDGEFPRVGNDGGIDLMSIAPKLGDRDVRSDDRYLFLETVMAARDRLHLSYVAEGVRDGKPRNPAAPLAELMAFLDTCTAPITTSVPDSTANARPWFVRHALQPFDARYFTGSDPRFFSFNAGFDANQSSKSQAQARFLPPGIVEVPVPEQPLRLASVSAYFRDPAKQVLLDRLGLRLDALAEEVLSDDEPLDARADPSDRLPQWLLREALQRGEFILPATPSPELRLAGLLPPGRAGQRAYATLRASVDPLLQQAHTDDVLRHGLPPREALAVDRTLGEFHLQGTLSRVHAIEGGWLLFDAFPNKENENAIDFRERVPLLMEWALLQLHIQDHGGSAELRLLYAGKSQEWYGAMRRCAWSPAQWQARLLALLRLYWRGQHNPAMYFQKTSWAVSRAKPGNELSDARKAWEGGGRSMGERDYSPGYARLLSRGVNLLDPEQHDWEMLLQFTSELDSLLRLDDVSEATP